MKIAPLLASIGQTLITCRQSDRISTAAKSLSKQRIGAMPVIDNEHHLVGIISERDIVRALAEHDETTHNMRVEELMTKKVITISPDDTVSAALELMGKNQIRHLPVVNGGDILGVISIRDVLDFQISETAKKSEQLQTLAREIHN